MPLLRAFFGEEVVLVNGSDPEAERLAGDGVASARYAQASEGRGIEVLAVDVRLDLLDYLRPV